MSLKAELDAFRSEFMAHVRPEVCDAMVRADMELAASGIAQRALKAGDRAPDSSLPDARGGHVRLNGLLAAGPVVLSFYRGGWCPYCNLELRALQQVLPEITRLGAKLVAVSPQTPDESLSTAEEDVKALLRQRHRMQPGQEDDFSVRNLADIAATREASARTLALLLAAVAGVSLAVGGIGIMNIMLASVLERIREIGVRRAMGATQKDILFQFLSEAVLISVAGGVAGILVGAGLSMGIEKFAGITTIVSLLSVIVAFGVSFTVGLAFGIVPAYRAARQDPVVCLRYE